MEKFSDLKEREIRPGYEVHKLHHYTTMLGLGSILRKGYIEARESKGDEDFGDMIKNHKAVSFLDGDYDNELQQMYSCNDQGRTLEGLTLHLGIHQKTICALIAIDLDKLPKENEVEFLETITEDALKCVDEWNADAYDGAQRYKDATLIWDTMMEFHKAGNHDNEALEAELIKRGISEAGLNDRSLHRDFYSWGDPWPDYSQKVLKNRVDHYEGGKDVKLEKMSDEEIAQMKQAIEDIDVKAVYKMLRKKGVPAWWFNRIKDGRAGGWQGEAEGKYWCASNSAQYLISYVFSALQRSDRPFYGPTFEMRIPENIPLTADNCKIYIFKNMIQKDKDKERVDKVIEYNNSHKNIPIQILEAGDRIEP